MIDKLIIKNYQSHKSSTLEFSSGVNCIIGSSDSGKTAVLRAMNWIINNQPSGDSFRSNWGGDTEATLVLDSQEIRRSRTKSKNEYQLNDLPPYKSFGQDVPEDIKKLLNFSELNIQYQMDSPFLLSSSSPEVARYMNQIVNLDKIDLVMSAIESKRRKINQDIASAQSAIERSKEQLKEYSNLEQMESIVEEIERFVGYNKKLKQDLTELNDIIITLSEAHDELEEIEKRLTKKEDADLLNTQMILLNEKKKAIQELKEIKDSLSELQKRHQEIEKKLVIKIKAEALNNQVIFLEEREKKRYQLTEIRNTLFINISKKKELDRSLQTLEKDYHELMPDVCPLCGRSG